MAAADDAPPLSGLDRLIIAQLQRNGRTPFRALATQLGVSEATVQRRTQQMIDAGYFKIIGVVDPLRWGQGHGVLIGINAEPGAINSILRSVGEIPQMRFVSLVTGTFDVVCELLTFERSTLIAILTERLSQIPGIHGVNTSWVIQVHKTNYLWDELTAIARGDDESAPAPTSARGEEVAVPAPGGPPAIDKNGHLIDALDRAIVAALHEDGRLSYAELAVRLGATESTVRRRTLRLLESEYLRVVAIGNPFRLGFEEVVLLWVKVALPHATSVLDQLARQPAVRYLSRVAGAADIVAEALFHDRTALQSFLDGPLAGIDGIREVAVSFELTIHKRAYVRFD
jgi:DNA-binding Lrp family transcriptional regulator